MKNALARLFRSAVSALYRAGGHRETARFVDGIFDGFESSKALHLEI
jgi:hypothetical protein